MSHKATKWLAEVPPDRIKSGAFRVLFHLCDCHNPADGCFPSQAYLIENTGLSNGGLNNALNELERAGLISRHRRVDQETRKKRPTRYMLAFEKGFEVKLDFDGEPSPDSGDGNGPKPSPDSGDGAISTFGGEPSPLLGQSHLQWSGDKPVREPVKNQRARENGPNSADDLARFWAEKINQKKSISVSAIGLAIARRILALGLCSEEQLRGRGIQF